MPRGRTRSPAKAPRVPAAKAPLLPRRRESRSPSEQAECPMAPRRGRPGSGFERAPMFSCRFACLLRCLLRSACSSPSPRVARLTAPCFATTRYRMIALIAARVADRCHERHADHGAGRQLLDPTCYQMNYRCCGSSRAGHDQGRLKQAISSGADPSHPPDFCGASREAPVNHHAMVTARNRRSPRRAAARFRAGRPRRRRLARRCYIRRACDSCP